jgi:hypothetical protein
MLELPTLLVSFMRHSCTIVSAPESGEDDCSNAVVQMRAEPRWDVARFVIFVGVGSFRYESAAKRGHSDGSVAARRLN